MQENRVGLTIGSQAVNITFQQKVRMRRRTVGLSVVMTGCALIFSGGLMSAENLPPWPPVPQDYAGKKCRPWIDRPESY
jgi:hypothetical protein